MGVFNTLNTKINCPSCNQKTPIRLQFKFGDTWQYEYQMNDEIRWGGNDVGKKSGQVKIYGVLEEDTCLPCSSKLKEDEYDILVENNRISKITKLASIEVYLQEEGGRYYVIK